MPAVGIRCIGSRTTVPENFARHLVHFQAAPAYRLERHMIGDINRDSRPNVVIMENSSGNLRWLEPTTLFLRSECLSCRRCSGIQNLGQGYSWTKHVVDRSLEHAFEAVVADFDCDGDIDITATAWRAGHGAAIAWDDSDGQGGLGSARPEGQLAARRAGCDRRLERRRADGSHRLR
jgi:hypothetical protein